MDKRALTAEIKRFALSEAGFDLVGVSAAVLPGRYGAAFEDWLAAGCSGDMAYMAKDSSRRYDARNILVTAKSVLSLAVNYFHPDDPRPEGPGWGHVAKFAYGEDYHGVLRERVSVLIEAMRRRVGAGFEAKGWTDTGPVLEKAYACQAGLGAIGKNTTLITGPFGSWVFLATVITNAELEPDAPAADVCGDCRRCLDACPTGALTAAYRLEARRCIAYWTLEARGEPPASIAPALKGRAYGCDLCQEVCPRNRGKPVTAHREFYPTRVLGSWAKPGEFLSPRRKARPIKERSVHDG